MPGGPLQNWLVYCLCGGRQGINNYDYIRMPRLEFTKPQLYSLECAQAVLARLRNNVFVPANIKESYTKDTYYSLHRNDETVLNSKQSALCFFYCLSYIIGIGELNKIKCTHAQRVLYNIYTAAHTVFTDFFVVPVQKYISLMNDGTYFC